MAVLDLDDVVSTIGGFAELTGDEFRHSKATLGSSVTVIGVAVLDLTRTSEVSPRRHLTPGRCCPAVATACPDREGLPAPQEGLPAGRRERRAPSARCPAGR